MLAPPGKEMGEKQNKRGAPHLQGILMPILWHNVTAVSPQGKTRKRWESVALPRPARVDNWPLCCRHGWIPGRMTGFDPPRAPWAALEPLASARACLKPLGAGLGSRGCDSSRSSGTGWAEVPAQVPALVTGTAGTLQVAPNRAEFPLGQC